MGSLEQWCDLGAVALTASVAGGTGVIAKRDLAVGEIISKVPKSVLLSVRNTDIAEVLDKAGLRDQLGVAVALMHERSKGASSKWSGYISNLPERENVPIFWDDAALAELVGTEIQDSTTQDREGYQRDYETIVLPFTKAHPALFPGNSGSYSMFCSAVSVVASRAFWIDKWHGEALVPVGDMYNHRLSRMPPESSDEENDEDDDDMGDEPAKQLWSPCVLSNDNAAGREMLPPMHISFSSKHEADVLAIVIAAPVAANEEVFNCYGEHGNAVCCTIYGFAEVANPFDVVIIEKGAVFHFAEQLLGSGHCTPREQLVCSCPEIFGEEEYYQLDVASEEGSAVEGVEPCELLPTQMLAAVHIMCLDDQRFMIWQRTDTEKKRGLVRSLKPRSILTNVDACVIALGCVEERMSTYPTDLPHDLHLLHGIKGEEAVRRFAALHKLGERTVEQVLAGQVNGAGHRPELLPALLVRLGEKAILARAHAMLVANIGVLRGGLIGSQAGAVGAGGAAAGGVGAAVAAGGGVDMAGTAGTSGTSIFADWVEEKERERQAEAARIASAADGEEWLPSKLQKKEASGDVDMSETGDDESKKKGGKKKKKKRKK
jgi:SET domain-containing protein 6